MIDSDAFGLKDFSLVESSEAGMVSQVSRAVRRNQWIVYLVAPHPMNSNVEMEYLLVVTTSLVLTTVVRMFTLTYAKTTYLSVKTWGNCLRI